MKGTELKGEKSASILSKLCVKNGAFCENSLVDAHSLRCFTGLWMSL